MARAVIAIDDTEGLSFNASVCYEEGFKIDSPAHCTGLLLMKHLNTLAEPQGEEVIFGGAPSAREAIQGTKPEDAIPGASHEQAEEPRVA